MAGAFQQNAFQNNAFQVEASLPYGHGQAQARIISFGTTVFGQAQSVIKQTYQQYAQASVHIVHGIRLIQSYSAVITANPDTPSFSQETGAGNVLIAFSSTRGSQTTGEPSSTPAWQEIEPPYEDSGTGFAVPNAGRVQAWWRYTTGGETSLGSWSKVDGAGNYHLAIYEFSGSVLYNSEGLTHQSSTTHPTGTVTTPDGKSVIIFAIFQAPRGGNGVSYSPDSPYIELADVIIDPSGATSDTIIYRVIDTTTTTSYSTGTTVSTSSEYASISVSFSIVNTYGHGQAQASIFVAALKPAQANASIFKLDEVKHGQAQARIGQDKVYGQAQAFMVTGTPRMFGQAQADILATSNKYGQAQASIAYKRWAHGQSQGYLRKFGEITTGLALAHINNTTSWQPAQATALIDSPIKQAMGQAMAHIFATKVYGQAQAWIDTKLKVAQAQAHIKKLLNIRLGQAQADIKAVNRGHGQANAYILSRYQVGQSQALIKKTTAAYGQAQAQIHRSIAFGNAQAYIDGVFYLVKFNGYVLPGYAQSESLATTMAIGKTSSSYIETFTEYRGLQNKVISLTMKTNEATYAENKVLVMKAGSILRSTNKWAKLYIQKPDRYYLAITQSVKMDQEARQRALDYSIEWEALPWLFSDTIYTASGTGTVTINRTIADGGWTPASIVVTGTNITISGYTATQYAGYITVSGAVTNFEIDVSTFTATDPSILNPTYELYIGPGTTTIETTGASSMIVTWQNRWYL